jgi:hypothetical protein
MKKENRLDALCREIVGNYEYMTNSGELSEALASLVRYYTMFRYSFEDFRTLYKVYYLPAAKAVSLALRTSYESSVFKDSAVLDNQYFEKSIEEKLQEGYVSLYHRVEALIKHLDNYFAGNSYGVLIADSSRKLEGSAFEALASWGINKELLYKSDKKIPPPNYCINRLRLIANFIKHDGGVSTNEANSSRPVPNHGANLEMNSDNLYRLNEVTFYNDMAVVNLYCDLLFKLTFRLDLQRQLDKLTLSNLDVASEFERVKVLEAEVDSAFNKAQIKLMVEAIRSDSERAFIERLIPLGIAH